MISLNPHYITNSAGEKLSVVLPLQEFNAIMKELEAIHIIQNDSAVPESPDWHRQIVSERLDSYRRNPGQAMDFESSMDDIEAGL